MKDKYIFILPGHPVATYKDLGNSSHMRDNYTSDRCRCTITLQNQCEELDIITKPFDLTIKFFMKNTYEYRRKPPSLIKLLRFVNHIAEGVVYTKENLIHTISTQKIYSKKPHTEIIIIPSSHPCEKDEYAKTKDKDQAK